MLNAYVKLLKEIKINASALVESGSFGGKKTPSKLTKVLYCYYICENYI